MINWNEEINAALKDFTEMINNKSFDFSPNDVPYAIACLYAVAYKNLENPRLSFSVIKDECFKISLKDLNFKDALIATNMINFKPAMIQNYKNALKYHANCSPELISTYVFTKFSESQLVRTAAYAAEVLNKYYGVGKTSFHYYEFLRKTS